MPQTRLTQTTPGLVLSIFLAAGGQAQDNQLFHDIGDFQLLSGEVIEDWIAPAVISARPANETVWSKRFMNSLAASED